MKKIAVLLILITFVSLGYASKLSKFLNKMEADNRAQEQREWQQDMNFNDFAFRLDRRYIDDQGQNCRDYEFRARSNPYRHGYFTVCDEH